MIRRALGTVVSVTSMLVLTGPAAGAEPVSLEQAVADAMLVAKADEAVATYGQSSRAALEPLVEPKRSAHGGDWVFGGSVFPIPDAVDATPVTSLFFAERDAEGSWNVALEGSQEFAEFAGEAPSALFVDEGERASLATPPQQHKADVGQPTGLALPWRKGQGGWRHSGLHGQVRDPAYPYNALDFFDGDGLVRASAGGYLYRFCTTVNPFIKVRHPNGWTTGYYHQVELTDVPDGSWIDAYDVIGVIAQELPCQGGESNRDHVHWALFHGDEPVALDGMTVGGWTWHAGAEQHTGYGERKGRKLYSDDCCLRNYGPQRPDKN